ncbi:EF-hand domain-containing family member B [Pararge aegeria]|uniref:Jg6681 protein n=1 Tax=Pararge aegeria aegeria TaxID=348720 RepID=A0A8S4SMA1_9NEOP|nr:EF-hand domain-containing family member B [Pararge aegeria]CAH2266981.1 jg6681 [Pararge aegeria aegeria]
MPADCQRSTSGGKGNLAMFVERDPNVCAAGLPTAQPDHRVSDSLQHYLLNDEVDALISDAIIPPKKSKPFPPLRHPIHPDKRYDGLFGQVPEIIHPPVKTKFQTLIEDFKDTSYSSYWKKPLGRIGDIVPMLPEGFHTSETTFGKKTDFHGRLYDIVMPKESLVDKTPQIKKPGFQAERGYCNPPYTPELTFGHRTLVDKRGVYAKCCLTDDRTLLGTSKRTMLNTVLSKFQGVKQSRIGTVLAPNDNISNLSEGHTFGKLKPPDNLAECLTYYDINPSRDFLRKCLAHLNCLRKNLSKRFLPTFFRDFYLHLKYDDTEKSGWLPKEVVYKQCSSRLIRFDSSLIEPLIDMWQAFDGSRIEYKTFVHVINYREPSPEIPKIPDFPLECLDFSTTYTDMVKPAQEVDKRKMAGLPSGRYFDLDYPITPERCCKADRAYFSHESDMKACLSPSVFTLLHVNHRDMYAKREPHVVKRVFEATGESLNDEKFNAVWKEAQSYHSQGWVCYETFKNALQIYSQNNKEMVK